MDYIQDHITTVEITRGLEIFEPSEKYPFGAMKYKCVVGKDMRLIERQVSQSKIDAIATKLAAFLNELHAIKPCEIFETKQECINELNDKLCKAIESVAHLLNETQIAKALELIEKYKQIVRSRDFCITHGDMHEGNFILNDDNELVGVIDFGNIGISLPEEDFIFLSGDKENKWSKLYENYNGNMNIKTLDLFNFIRKIRAFRGAIRQGAQTPEYYLSEILEFLY